MSDSERYRLGSVTLDSDADTLSGPRAKVHLEPRVTDFAVRLARRPGAVVTREELIDRVWEGYPGADQSLTNAASKLRRALVEAGGDRDLLETVPKRGYRLRGGARVHAPFGGASGRRRIVVAVPLVVFLLLGSLIVFDGDAPQGSENSIAVLAFEDLSPHGDHEYLSRGIAEELLNLLARVPGLRVVGRTSAFSFAGKDVTIPEIGEQLNVNHVLEGSVRRSGDRLRITVQLLEAGPDRHVWSETYEQSLDDIFAVQDRIATDVANELRVRLAGGTPAVRKTDPRTYALYLRLAHAYLYAGDLDAAETRIRRYTRIAEGGWITLGNIVLLKGEPEVALAAYDRQKPPSGHEAYWLASRAMAFHELGRRSEFDQTMARLIEKWGEREPRAVARAYAWAGETDKAFEWLGRGIDGYFDVLVGNPFFRALHDDPRWFELLEGVGLGPADRADLALAVAVS